MWRLVTSEMQPIQVGSIAVWVGAAVKQDVDAHAGSSNPEATADGIAVVLGQDFLALPHNLPPLVFRDAGVGGHRVQDLA